MGTKLLLVSITIIVLLVTVSCGGTVPQPFREPAQEAVEQAVKTPGIDLYVNIGGLSSRGLNVSVGAKINNPNPVSLDIGNLQVVAKGETGQTYVKDAIPGASVAPNSSRTFNHSIIIPLDVISERNMIVTVDTRAGAAGITLPVSATITVTTPDLQNLISAPGIVLSVNVGQLSSNGLRTDLQANISNPNPVTLDIGDMHIVIKGQSGNVIMTSTMIGGSIAPNSIGTLTSDITIPLQVLNERNVMVTADTRAGVAGITLPVTATITVNIPDIQSLISVPDIALSVNMGSLSSNGLDTSLQANINNPNPLSLDIGNLQIVMRGQAGNVITTSTMMGGSIAPNSSGTFTSDLVIPLQVLNERSIVVTADTRVGVAGITLPISATVTVNIPDIQTIINLPKATVDAHYKPVPMFPLPGLEISTETTITNSNDFGLFIGDLHINISRSNGTRLQVITIQGITIDPNSSQTFSRSATFGPDIVLGLIGSDYLAIEGTGEVGISGINQKIPFPIPEFKLYLLPDFP